MSNLCVPCSSLTGRRTCGCNSSQSRSPRLLNCNSDHDGVFIVNYIRLIRGSCRIRKHMNPFAWIFGAINQCACWFCGFPNHTLCESAQCIPLGIRWLMSCLENYTSWHWDRLRGLSFIHLRCSCFIIPLICHIYNLRKYALSRLFSCSLDPPAAGLSRNQIKRRQSCWKCCDRPTEQTQLWGKITSITALYVLTKTIAF